MIERSHWVIAMAIAAVLAAGACTTDAGDKPTASSSSSASVPASASESVPPGVQKDSVLDLNSTKDMTGVVTTVTFNDSPYAAHLPDICKLIPDDVVKQLGAASKVKGFDGINLVTQSCLVNASIRGLDSFGITAAVYINNIDELLDQPSTRYISRNVFIAKMVTGTVFQNADTDVRSSISTTCRVAWGTFYGAASINVLVDRDNSTDPCAKAIEAARAIAPHMPSAPIQMRPSA